MKRAGRWRCTLGIGAIVFLLCFLAGLFLPEKAIIPVQGATTRDWNHESFWYAPWGASGVHKGIDIFAPERTPVVSATYGVVIYAGRLARGGKVAAVLGPGYRIHYYAHLADIHARVGDCVTASEIIGSVGDTGNANGTPHHLHYSIVSLFPHPWRRDESAQGWKKMFFIDPTVYLGGDR